MPTDWHDIAFGDFCDITRGGSPRPIHDFIAPEGIPWVKIADVARSGTRFIDETKEFIRPEGESKSRRVFHGDLILSNSASPGIPMFMGIEACIHDGWMLLRNLRDVDKLFCFYLLQHEKPKLLQQGNGSVFMNLKTDILKSHRVKIPELDEQRAIASVLGSLDDKIEQNRRTAGVLERLARAIFRAWFVDFEPVHAKAAGATHFPAMPQPLFDQLPTTFQDSELGPIPQGWEVGVPNALFGFVLGGDWGKAEPTDQFSEEARCIRGADIPDLQLGGLGKMPQRFIKKNSLIKRQLNVGDLAFEISGGSPTQSTGRPILMTSALQSQVDAPVICSNFCRLIRPATGVSSFYLYRWLLQLYHDDVFLQFENGSTGIKNLAFRVFSETYSCLIPSEQMSAGLDEALQPLVEMTGQLSIESRKLAELRDYLLPKLLSGAVRVDGVAAPVTRAAPVAPAPAPNVAPAVPPCPTAAAEPELSDALPPRAEDCDRLEVLATLRDLYRDDPAPCDRETLLHLLKEALGFKTLSPKLRGQLEGDLRAAVRRWVIVLQDGEYHLDCRHVTDYRRDILKGLFLQALGGTWWDREAAMHQAATHLGYRRLGKSMRAAFKSAINGLLRENRLESSGDQIRKV